MRGLSLNVFAGRILKIFKEAGVLDISSGEISDEYDMAVHAVIREMRRNWLKGRASNGFSSASKLNRSRFSRRKSTEILRRYRSKPRVKLPKNLLAHRYKESKLLSGLIADRKQNWLPLLKRTRPDASVEIEIQNFSFIDNPIETLRAIKAIALAECRCVNSYIHFKDDFCQDVAPYLVLAEAWPAMAHIFRGGKMNLPVQKMIDAVGLRKSLGMTFKGLSNHDDLWAFPIQRRRPTGSSTSKDRFLAPQSHEKVTDRFCDAIDDWLGRPEINQSLTIEGRGWIGGIITEMLDNAERHADPENKDGEWSIAGFMARRIEDDEPVYRCYLAFMSIGATISESLLTCLPSTAGQIQNYCDRHARYDGYGPSVEALRTLYALQDTVTRDPEADSNGRGGFGFQEVMRFVHELGGTSKPGREPRITIISGSACIQLRPPYIMGTRAATAGSPRVLWCNAENSPMVAPDPAFVFDMQERLAGTIISVAFTLDPDYLNETV